MTDRPTRATTAGRAYLDLQNLARRSRRPTDELHQIYGLEGFLARLVESPYAERLVLKGGLLLAALDVRRPTRDVDFQGRDLSNDVHQVLAVVKSIASLDLDDGIVLDADAATAEVIRDQGDYSGVRVTLTGRISAARLTFHVDINVGDPIWPAPQTVTLPACSPGPSGPSVIRWLWCTRRSSSPRYSAAPRTRDGATSRTSTRFRVDTMLTVMSWYQQRIGLPNIAAYSLFRWLRRWVALP